jgi:hypothetical protein
MAFKRKNQYLKDPNGSNELTYVQDEYSQEPYGQEYENPYKDAYNLPEGQTYLAPSAAPSSAFADPSAPRPQDRSPADWKMNNSLDPEREQRYRVKAYLEQKYKKAASNRGVDEARVNADKLNMVGNVGHGLDRIFTAQSVAHKGPGADAGFWSGIKQQGQQGIRSAEDERRAKIEDYLTTQKMGREGAADLALNREYDQKAAMQNPNSEVSQRYQTLFAQRYPDYAEQIQGVPAAEIEVFAKYLQDQEKMEMEAQKVQEDKTNKDREYNLRERGLDIQDRGLDIREAQAPAAAQTVTREVTMPDGTVKTEVVKPNKATEALDRDYVKDYNDWTTNGRSDFDKNISQLRQAREEMQKLEKEGKGSQVTGKMQSFLGRVTGDLARSDVSNKIQSKVHAAVIGSLKATMGGGQITDSEREDFLSKSFDAKLPLKDNIEKIDVIMQDLTNRAIRQEEKARHFEKNQTLGGFKSKSVEPMVKIQSPDGEVRLVPESSVNKYLQKGGKVVQ